MDKQQITRQLQRLAQEEIAEDMNLWPRIQGQLKRKSKPRSFSLAQALSVFVMLILVSVGGYAAYQTTIPEAPIMADNATALGMVQTIGGITASLDWVYVDTEIITMQYSLIYNPQELSLPEYTGADLQTTSGLVIPPYNMGGGGGGGGGGDESSVTVTGNLYFDPKNLPINAENLDLLLVLHYRNPANNDFGLIPTVIAPDYIEPTLLPPDTMSFGATVTPLPLGAMQATAIFTATPIPFGDLQPTVPPPDGISATPIPPTVPPPANLTIEPSLIPPMQFTPTPLPAQPAFNFTFSFSVPVYPVKTGQVANANVAANGLALSIQDISISPLRTQFTLCYPQTGLEPEWYPMAYAHTAYVPSAINMLQGPPSTGLTGELIYPALASNYESPLEIGTDGRLCAPLMSYAAFSPDGGEIELSVEYLYRYADGADPAIWAADEAFFAAKGFDLTYAYLPFANSDEEAVFYGQAQPSNVMVYPLSANGVLLITLRDYPQALESWQAQNYIFENMLKERLVGPWVFHVVVGE